MGGLEIGFILDRRRHWMRGEPERSKKADLLLLARLFDDEGVRYALIAGVALQIHQAEPRTTIDIDVAFEERERIPRSRLETEGLRPTGRHAHSENWTAPDGTPVQFTDDPALRAAIERAAEFVLEGRRLRVLTRADLLREKLRATRDPARRRSKRLQDLADAVALLEADPMLAEGLTEEERALLDRAP